MTHARRVSTPWKEMADRPYRDTITCACGATKAPGIPPKGWMKRFDVRAGHTLYRCPRCRV